MNYQKPAKSKAIWNAFKAADCTNSNDFVNAVNDLNIIPIHKRQKNYLESEKETCKRYYIIDESR